MKFNTIVRSAMATGMSLALGLGTVACSRDYTAAFVYSVSASNSTVAAFAVDFQSGILTQIAGSPFTVAFSNPTTLVASPNGKFIYVTGGNTPNQSSQVQGFAVGTDGKIYGGTGLTANITGTYATAAAIDPTGTFLYITYTYQTGFTPASPGPGGVTIFPISPTTGVLGTPINVNVGNNPVAISVAGATCTTTPVISTNTKCATGTVNSFVYVVDQETKLAAPTVLGFAQNTTTGALTPTSGTTFNTALGTYQGIHAGVTPSAIATDPTGRYVYVTDKTSNQLLGYQIASTSTGNLTVLVSSPYTTGLYPVAVTIDPRGKYLYTANYNSATVSGYSINSADGSLGGSAGSGNFSSYSGPTCVTIEPALGIYLYTSNYLDGSISGGQLSPNTGQINAVANQPFATGTLPSCLVAVANGSHASSLVNP